MPYCCVPNCRSGLSTQGLAKVAAEQNISFHKFPLKSPAVLVKKWLLKISRSDFVPTIHSKVYSLHFLNSDYRESTDCNKNRKRKRAGKGLQNRMLKADAYPSVFPNYPSYLSKKKSPKKRKSALKATGTARRQLADERQEEVITEYLSQDELKGLDDLKQRLKTEASIDGFDVISGKDCIAVCLYEWNDPCIPHLAGCFTVQKSLRFALSASGISIPPSSYSSIVTGHTIHLFSQVKPQV